MTIQQGEDLLQPFILASLATGNPFLIAQFSNKDNEYKGYFEGLDKYDAMIIIKQLVKHFELTELDAAVAGFKQIFQPEY